MFVKYECIKGSVSKGTKESVLYTFNPDKPLDEEPSVNQK